MRATDHPCSQAEPPTDLLDDIDRRTSFDVPYRMLVEQIPAVTYIAEFTATRRSSM